MKWDELSDQERNRLVHEKVLNLAIVCPGKIEASYVKVPSRGGGTAYAYWHIACDACELIGYSDREEDIPKEHPPKTDIPSYSTDMNAAWQIVEKLYGLCDIRLYVDKDNFNKYYVQMWHKQDGRNVMAYGVSDTSMPGAICKAALSAKGVEIV